MLSALFLAAAIVFPPFPLVIAAAPVTAEIKALLVKANAGDADAQFEVATAYDEGSGTAVDDAEAAHCYAKASEAGHAAAQVNLARLYEGGDGVPLDLVKAHTWLAIAESRGNLEAKRARSLLEKKLKPAQLAEAKKAAKAWLNAHPSDGQEAK
jgi:TPR repeat protein